MRLPSVCLIVLVGPSGAGKSHWAADWFRPELAGHCEDAGRDPAEVRVTHLSTSVVEHSRRELDASLARLQDQHQTPEHRAEALGAGIVEDQVGRYRELADAGVQTAIVSLPDGYTPGALEAFGRVIEAFDQPPPIRDW